MSSLSMRLTDEDWGTLLRRIKLGQCTPFLGAGVNKGVLPLGSEVAKEWAAKHSYPLGDSTDLARVSQYLAVTKPDKLFPKEEFQEMVKIAKPPEFGQEGEIHGIISDLPLPIYMTTNYDDFMYLALQKKPDKVPRSEACRWNSIMKKKFPSSASKGFPSPSVAKPLVYHLHGNWREIDSMVLTEDDYLDFLVNLSKDEKLLPPRIQEALTNSSLLFLGYRLTDWTFRVLFKGLVSNMEDGLRRISIAVQLPPESANNQHVEALKYMNSYFSNIHVKVYWGTAQEFARELHQRWSTFLKEST